MRRTRLAVAACAAAAAFATPASAGPPDLSNVVTVEWQGPVDCVTYPCWQPMPVVVCVVSAGVCTPR